jgi:cold shock CspA family protein
VRPTSSSFPLPRSSTSAVRPFRGRVTEFDAHRGLGLVVTDDGSAFPFHCTQIVDDSRVVDVGAAVEFAVIPGGIGRWEAGEIVKLSP